MQIQPSWLEANNVEIEFKYVHGSQADKDITMKVVQKDGNKINVSFKLEVREPDLMTPQPEQNNVVLQMDESEFEEEKFNDLDSWFQATALFKAYKEHIEKKIIKTAPPVGLFQNRNSPFFQANRPMQPPAP